MISELILLVDDEPSIVQLARMYLERENFRVETARDGTANTPEAQMQAAQVIFSESGRMHRMVLDLARLDAGTLDLQHTQVDLTALLNSIAENFAPQARIGNVDIRVEASTLPAITGDGDHLAQVLTNLVDNGLEIHACRGQHHAPGRLG